jgi:hypothetical protein
MAKAQETQCITTVSGASEAQKIEHAQDEKHPSGM